MPPEVPDEKPAPPEQPQQAPAAEADDDAFDRWLAANETPAPGLDPDATDAER